MKIGVYVGSFNPVHKGHIEIIKRLLEKQYLDKVIIIPTLDYWDKKGLEPLTHRVAMLKFFETETIIVDDSKSTFPYTYEIMNTLRKEYPQDALYLIIGADNIKEFHKWKNVDEILKNHVMIIPRDNIDIDSYIQSFQEKDRFVVVSEKVPQISSTSIREQIKMGKINELEEELGKQVLAYIVQKGLYKEEI